jgi:hypothetical protein
MNRASIYFLIMLLTVSCMNNHRENVPMNMPKEFDKTVLNSELPDIKTSGGQLLYLPVYSNIPFQIDTGMFDMSAFVAIHNTDLDSKLCLTQVLYFNQEGMLVDDFLKGEKICLDPLATKEFYIPYEDRSGTGANFLIEWISDSLITEPLVESVTLCLKPNNTLAIRSEGRIIREKRK